MTAPRPKGAGAVMASRLPSADDTDYFPTPPWATRALIEHVLMPRALWRFGSAWEPACGEGHMARVLQEYLCERVDASDLVDRGYGRVADFLWPGVNSEFPVDWIITNPPFSAAEQFVLKALELAHYGVAMLARTNFLEGVGRFQRLYRPWPMSFYCPFSERVPMVKGRLDRTASTATAYAWFVWLPQDKAAVTETVIIPPCRAELERPWDYDQAAKR